MQRRSEDGPSIDDRTQQTGTTTVAVTGADCVVVAADARASIGGGRFVSNRSMQKVEPIGESTALAFSGSVSDAQSFTRQLRAERRLYDLRHDGTLSTESIATVAGNTIRRGPYRVLDLVIGGVDDTPSVYSVGPGGGVMESEYAASGSGMQLAYGSIEDGYEPGLPLEDVKRVATRAIESAAARDTASGDGMTVASITRDGLERQRFDDVGPTVLGATDAGEVA